jgi:hypothetical protein
MKDIFLCKIFQGDFRMEKKNNTGTETIKPEPLFPLKGYLILNLIFWAYCILQLAVLSWIFKDVVGLIFFFIVLGVGFSLVSAYDYIYDRIAYKNKSEETGENKPE